jgi:hypothetical protein
MSMPIFALIVAATPALLSLMKSLAADAHKVQPIFYSNEKYQQLLNCMDIIRKYNS